MLYPKLTLQAGIQDSAKLPDGNRWKFDTSAYYPQEKITSECYQYRGGHSFGATALRQLCCWRNQSDRSGWLHKVRRQQCISLGNFVSKL